MQPFCQKKYAIFVIYFTSKNKSKNISEPIFSYAMLRLCSDVQMTLSWNEREDIGDSASIYNSARHSIS